MIKRVYIDTSVVGGQFDKEFSADTLPFFNAVTNGQLILIVSDLLEAELLRAPQHVKDFLATLPAKQIVNIQLTQDAAQLANEYILAKVVDVLVSWNFKHIVNLDKIRGYNGINYQLGHSMIEIRTPKEIINDDNDNL